MKCYIIRKKFLLGDVYRLSKGRTYTYLSFTNNREVEKILFLKGITYKSYRKRLIPEDIYDLLKVYESQFDRKVYDLILREYV